MHTVARFSPEDNGGGRTSLADMVSRTKGKGAVLSELSCYLHVESERVKVRLSYDTSGNTYIYIYTSYLLET